MDYRIESAVWTLIACGYILLIVGGAVFAAIVGRMALEVLKDRKVIR